ncbi:helix-turn-helix domain-containing protein [Gordonia sp. CPCC 205333]|uniref:helix-turn-helix domain-containing protein n=1 Tax=Gordonia sp. CPCC 205333 TaxID=3140790 RepID=UPI003AF3A513
MSSSEPESMVTVAEAAGILGISRRGVTAAIRSNRLTARKLQGRTGAYLLDLDEVRKFAALRTVGA